ncbi:MAG: Hsp20/alpha crystallin family protein, partial [Candidatus Binataceae bacterium]
MTSKLQDNASASREGGSFHMEVVLENGWNGNGWMLERLAGFRRALDEATDQHTAPRADVTEDKDAYHFYVEMPGLKVSSIDVQIEGDSLMVAAERKRPESPQETQLHIAERGYSPIKRAFTLPLNARRDGIRAAYTDGVLELTVE